MDLVEDQLIHFMRLHLVLRMLQNSIVNMNQDVLIDILS